MPVRYKVYVLAALKEKATLQKIRRGEPVSWDVLGKICTLLSCQPGDILEYAPEGSTAQN